MHRAEARIARLMGPRKPVNPRQRGDSSGSKGMFARESCAASNGREVQSQWTEASGAYWARAMPGKT